MAAKDQEFLADVIALSCLRGTSTQILTTLLDKDISPTRFLAMTPSQQGAALGLTQIPVWDENDLREAKAIGKREAEFCNRHRIRVISPFFNNFPRRLAILDNAPTLLYMLGEADLDALHVIGIVGTRKITAAGLRFTQSLVKDLGTLVNQPLVVSGLAYGTDAAAHTAALDNNLPTLGVLAHGLSMIYPAAHRQLAEKIIAAGGGLLTQYHSIDKPFRGHFLERNRIIAALSDGVLVVESAIKGGAMNTAHAAFDFDRAVMAVPGRPSDPMSEGCNHLIRKQIAMLTTDARQACDAMGWETNDAVEKENSPVLFREPEADLLPVYNVIQQSEVPVGIDELTLRCRISPSQIAAKLFALEEEGFVTRLPNNRYTLS